MRKRGVTERAGVIMAALSNMQTVALAGCGGSRCLDGSQQRLCRKCENLLTKISVRTLTSLLTPAQRRAM